MSTLTTCPTCGNSGTTDEFVADHTCSARIVSISHLGDMANQRAFRVVANYGDHETVTVFRGTPYGPYGVYMSWHDQWIRVEDPARFGDAFDKAWIREFFRR